MGDLDGMFRRFFTAIATMIAALSTMLSQGHSEGLGDEWAWYLLGVSALLQGSTTLFACFMPFKRSSIYLKSMENIMMNEVSVFLAFLVSASSRRKFQPVDGDQGRRSCTIECKR
jgi:hypothetical protein